MKISLTLLALSFIFINVNKAEKYEFYTFSSKWPGTACKFTDCWQNETRFISGEDFNIHGLWPSSNPKKDSPAFCNPHSQFQMDSFNNSLVLDLRKFWNPLMNSEHNFYKHEWLKHGTCMNQSLDYGQDLKKQIDFFKMALELSEQFHLYELFKSVGIQPSSEL